MSSITISEELQKFLANTSQTTLELTFQRLHITLFNQNVLLGEMLKTDVELIFQKCNDTQLLIVDVPYNPVFPFEFTCEVKPLITGLCTKMKKLPEPVSHGSLGITNYSLNLEFSMDSSSEDVRLQVKQLYTHPSNFGLFRT